MHNRSEILRTAWADYRRDDRAGLVSGNGSLRHGPFCRSHFAYCLRMAWAAVKARVAKAAADAAERAALIREAGNLNNHPVLVKVDHVTFMGLLDLAECRAHVAKLRGYIIAAHRPAATKARIAELETELRDQEYDDRLDRPRRRELRVELSRLTA